MSNFQYRSIMSVAWLSVGASMDNIWLAGAACVITFAYTIGANFGKHKEPV